MPVYNSEQYLKRSIESVLNQTYRNIELLCVDDFSLDDSLNILNEYQKIDNRIKIIEFKQNKGQGFARNEALKQSSGDYIMFLDSDDSFELNTCELVLNQIVKNNNEFVFFDYVKHFSNRKARQTKTRRREQEAEYPTISTRKLKSGFFFRCHIVRGFLHSAIRFLQLRR